MTGLSKPDGTQVATTVKASSSHAGKAQLITDKQEATIYFFAIMG